MRILPGGPPDPVHQLAFAAGGRRLLARYFRSPAVGVWDLGTGEFSLWKPAANRDVTALAVDPGGDLVAVGDAAGEYRVGPPPWASPTGRGAVTRSFGPWLAGLVGPPAAHALLAVGFAADAAPADRWVAAAGPAVELWNPHTRRSLRIPDRAAGGYQAVALAPGGTELAAIDADGPTVAGWALPLKAPAFRFAVEGPALHLAYVPDTDALAVAAGPAVELRGPAGQLVRRTPVRDGLAVTDFAFLPGGRVAAAAATPAVTVLDILTGEAVREYDFGIGRVFAVAAAPDGLTAAAAGAGGAVAVWDLDP